VRPVKYLDLTEQDHRYSRTLSFFNICTKGFEQSLNITPLDVC